MTAHQMVGHLAAALASSLDQNPPPEASGLLTKPPVRWAVIHLVPWPKGRLQAPEELLDWPLTTWENDMALLRGLVLRVNAKSPNAVWRASPVFGEMTGESWCALLGKHMDHHLKQFGV